MKYTKRNAAISTVEEGVLVRSGLSRQEFFHPVWEPYIHNLQEAVNFFRENADMQITVVGDYDADGVCGTAILYYALRMATGKDAKLRIPKRFSEGYGLSEKIIDEIPSPGLVITVDNGIAALGAIKKAKEKGLKVIIIDHHEPVRENDQTVLPCADVVVDPKADKMSEYREYCGAGLAYRFAKELLGREMKNLLVLASIATVADVMTLTGANRVLVRRGLEALNKGYGVPGLKALAAGNKQYGHFDEGSYGFWFGPVFNAYGRLEDTGAAKVLRLLTMAHGDPRMTGCVKSLLLMNERRKELAKDQTELAEMLIQDLEGHVERPIVVSDPMFEPGIVGIIAGCLAEKYHSPAIVFAEKDNVMKGSARSIPEVNLKDALDRINGLMLGYGGHAGAAGLSIKPDDFTSFQEAFKESVGRLPEISDILYYDLELQMEDIPHIVEEQRRLAPFGEGNPKPVFRMMLNTDGFTYARMGDGTHFLLMGTLQDTRLSVVGFGMSESYEALNPRRMECLGYVNENWYDDHLSYQFELTAFREM